MGWDPFGTKAAKLAKKAARAQAEAARAAAKAQAEALRFNAAVLERNAETVEVQGLVDEARYRRTASRLLGEQDAAIAGSGFKDVGFEDLREMSEDELDLDAIILRRKGQFQAADYLAQEELALMNAETAIAAGEAGARSAILEGNFRAHQAQSAAISNTIGLVISGVGAYRSDARVKTDLRRIGAMASGLPVYAFRFIYDEPGTVRHGVLAQEVLGRFPDAVSRDAEGVLCVDYGRIG